MYNIKKHRSFTRKHSTNAYYASLYFEVRQTKKLYPLE